MDFICLLEMTFQFVLNDDRQGGAQKDETNTSPKLNTGT